MSKEFKWGSLIAMVALSIWVIFGQILIVDSGEVSLFSMFSDPNSFTAVIVIALLVLNLMVVILNVSLSNEVKWLPLTSAGILLLTSVIYFYLPEIYIAINQIDDEVVSVFHGSSILINGFSSFLLMIIYIRESFKKFNMTVKDIAEMASLVGLSLVLDLAIFKLKVVPNGGSISLVMLPLFILSLRKGPLKGFIACGIVFGFINCIIDGYGIVTYPLDYLLGFGSIALAGFFKPLVFNVEGKMTVSSSLFLVLAIFLGCFGRLVFSTISGMVIYETAFVDSVWYQLSYIGPSSAIVLVALFLLYKPLIAINKRFEA